MDVIILAGGLGTRLRSVVSEVPKCMAPVAGKPFLYYLLKYVDRIGVDNVILSVGYLREIIFSWIDSVRDEFPFKIEYAIEERPLGTGGGIRLGLMKCKSDDVLVLNGDTIFDVPISKFLLFHHSNPSAAISIALKHMNNFERYGSVSIKENGEIVSFNEKKYCERGNINGGVYLIRKSLLNLLDLPEKFSFEIEVLANQVEKHIFYGCVFDDFFIDIGVPEDYQRAQFEFVIRNNDYNTLILDRDGTINRLRPNDYVKNWKEFEFLPLFLRYAKDLGNKFSHIFIVTNQRGVGKSLMTESDLDDIHTKMCGVLFNKYGLKIDKIYHCTSVNNDDVRRKPNIGMWKEIQFDYKDVVFANSTIMIGDSDGDQLFAERAGIHFARI